MKVMSGTASATRHAFGALSEALIIAAIIGALVFGHAVVSGASPLGASDTFPARGGNGRGGGNTTGGTLSVPDGVFGGTTTATANPGGDAWVKARCFQNGTLVYYQSDRVDLNNQVVLTLGPTPLWSAGGASCTAEEGYYTSNWAWRTLATTTFRVAAQ